MSSAAPATAAAAAALFVLAAAPPRAAAAVDPDPDRRPEPVCILWDSRVEDGFNFSRARAASLQRLLEAGGVSASLFPARELDAALSPPCRVAHLVAFGEASLPPGAAARLAAFVAGGGRLVAHGCSGRSLEALFGVRRVDPAPPPDGETAWDGFAFVATGMLDGGPLSVENETPFAPGCEPAEGGAARVLARWRAGASYGGPAALVRCPAGFWLSRVLYDDGPGPDRCALARAMTCALHAPLWDEAAHRLEERVWAPFGACSRAEAAERAIAEAAFGTRRAAEAFFESAADADAADAGADLRPVERVARLEETALAVELAAARIRPLAPLRAGRPLAVWEKTGYGPFDGDWERAADALAQAGVSDLMLFAGGLAGAVADLPGVPPDDDRARRGGADPFPAAVAACRARGIRVHAWLPLLQFDGAPRARRDAFAAAGRLLHRADGSTIDWLDPAHPDNAADLEAAVAHLARSGLDGLCLDYLRYPDFETAGDRAAREPALRALLARLRAAAKAAAPACAVRIAVFGSAVRGHSVIGQDWGAWLDADLADEAVPMNYVADADSLRRLLAAQRAHLPRALCGIGATSHAALLDGPALLEQLSAAYAAGCAGAAVYAFDRRFAAELAPVLEAAFAPPAPEP
ncbi:MAG: hypothetical protein IJV65_04415 [Kiritimatiellae bacterium]|nr:hypothetical protein [Kiritimatiellia bacterium]